MKFGGLQPGAALSPGHTLCLSSWGDMNSAGPPRPPALQISIGGNLFTGALYPFAEAQPQNTNVTLLPHMCGMVPVGILFAAGYDAYGSPGLGLPCPVEVAGGWPDVLDGF